MVQVGQAVDQQKTLVEERVAALDVQLGRVFTRDHAEVCLIELAVDGAQSAVQRHLLAVGRVAVVPRAVNQIPVTIRRRFVMKRHDGRRANQNGQ